MEKYIKIWQRFFRGEIQGILTVWMLSHEMEKVNVTA